LPYNAVKCRCGQVLRWHRALVLRRVCAECGESFGVTETTYIVGGKTYHAGCRPAPGPALRIPWIIAYLLAPIAILTLVMAGLWFLGLF
jgi:hypothetical protein